MKRKGLVAILAAIMVMASSAFCFADTGSLKLESTYPENGQKNTSIENVGVKLYFNNTISTKEAMKADEKLVKIVDSKGKKIDTIVLFKDNLVLVVADNTQKAQRISNSETYTLVIDPSFVDDQGNTLGEKTTVEFTTYNQKLNNIINMAMMFVMFGGIMFVTIKQQKDQAAEKAAAQQDKAGNNFNPYREAKRTGKTVEEVMAEEAKRQEKLNKKKGKKKEQKADSKHVKIENCADYLNNVYRVQAPRPIKKKATAAPATPAKKGKSGKR
ncbi:MAG: Ig-like domain-containing protein [Clostridiales bacterium]|nr:Ig-like domain-containing protein [Candidatus Crickella merdequi]